MRRVVFIVAAVAIAALAAPSARDVRAAPAPSEPIELILFWGDGCPHCEAERAFLEDLLADYPDLVVKEYEVWGSAANRQLFVETANAAGVEAQAVPTTFIGDRV